MTVYLGSFQSISVVDGVHEKENYSEMATLCAGTRCNGETKQK